MTQPIQFLERYWNHTAFRPMQEDIINAVLQNEDTFALLPTGGGKSLCFQIPALMRDGICIVVSPLVGLMKDQVNNLNDKGIKALAITSGISYSELDTLLDNCIYGNYKFLYLSPERLQQDLVKDRIQQMNVNLIAVDEAHCISQWGNDFRPAYKNIKILRELHPTVNVIALTATAKPDVVEDIISELDFISPKIFKASFQRPNIAYMILETDDKQYKVEQILKKHKGSSIIYVRTRRATIEINSYLESKGFSSLYYHGGLNSKEKQDHLTLWSQNEKEIMVATTAFGMGIDKADVKNIIHVNLPESLESYYQEAGRAGRNGGKSFAIILKSKTDEQALKNQFLNVLPSIDFLKQVYRKLCNYFQISYGEGEQTVHEFNFNNFCKTYEFNTAITFNALQILDRNSVISLTQQFNYQAKLQFLISNQSLFRYLETHKQFDVLVKSIMRTYGGIFENLLKININLISDKASISEDVVLKSLHQLKKDGVVDFQYSNTDAELTFLVPREDDKTINRISKHVEQQFNLKKHQIDAVIEYVTNNALCKNRQLLDYFGENIKTDCGMCSVCISKKGTKTESKSIIHDIIMLLENQPLSSRKIIENLSYDDKTVLTTLQVMIENDILELTPNNTYKIKHT
ncbi:RecQ family ATP-dependent DNA helicase [Subsaxibacter sp. CAU 1640]|uniref:RecQ family ATP-dependent DNA helicase n=1 Tax=Subsaxibacter sp. CAU 1640 TaxID=2933271 RepID=UPI002002BB61|nr:RecQ family ATP-dependent DNA helicase [Subsaxibacter sp. CAU 1640]MCK7591265.1 RecQ family ATP-dependent DNA helicase [Subsaxibacter sp. CAU 1640]